MHNGSYRSVDCLNSIAPERLVEPSPSTRAPGPAAHLLLEFFDGGAVPEGAVPPQDFAQTQLRGVQNLRKTHPPGRGSLAVDCYFS